MLEQRAKERFGDLDQATLNEALNAAALAAMPSGGTATLDRNADRPQAAAPDMDDLRGLSMFEKGRKVVATRPENPVAEIARELRGELHKFIHNNIPEPSQMGFLSKGNDAVAIDGLVRVTENSIRKLENYFSSSVELTPETINTKTLANGMEAKLEMFLINLKSMDYKHGVSGGDLSAVLQHSIALKEEMGEFMQQFDIMKGGFQRGAS